MHVGNVRSSQCCHQHDNVKRIEIQLKTGRHDIPVTRFVVEHPIEGFPVCDETSRIAEDMVAELIDHAFSNVVILFVETLVALQTTLFLDSGFVTWLYNPLRPCE